MVQNRRTFLYVFHPFLLVQVEADYVLRLGCPSQHTLGELQAAARGFIEDLDSLEPCPDLLQSVGGAEQSAQTGRSTPGGWYIDQDSAAGLVKRLRRLAEED